MTEICAIDEYNNQGHLIYSENFIGSFVRGETREAAIGKFAHELAQYACWCGLEGINAADTSVNIVQEKLSPELNVRDADSDVTFLSELPELSITEYNMQKALALKSAKDFLTFYESIPDKDATCLKPRRTFYGDVPITARQMYIHTKNVNNYYFGEIGVAIGNEPDIYVCRLEGLNKLEAQPDFLKNAVFNGSSNESWTLRKVLRRFIWHDRIHAKAMYKLCVKQWGASAVRNVFKFEL